MMDLMETNARRTVARYERAMAMQLRMAERFGSQGREWQSDACLAKAVEFERLIKEVKKEFGLV